MDELGRLVGFCLKLGAPAAQAEVMARQLAKRAGQLAAERKLSREEALAYLLQLVVQGQQGEIPPGFKPPAGPPGP